MSFKDVKELRKAGKLNEAMELAKLSLTQNPDDIWNKRSIAWVHYEFLKQNASVSQYETFKTHLVAVKELHLPEDEKMVFDQAAFQIGKLLFSIKDAEDLNHTSVNLDELFELIKSYHFTIPSESYTFLYKGFHRFNKAWEGYLDFCDWWDFDNFQPSDYLAEEFKGRKLMATVEQAHIAYAKKLLTMPLTDPSKCEMISKLNNGIDRVRNPWKVQEDRTKAFVEKLEVIVNDHPEYQYPEYYLAKLYITSSDHGHDALKTFLPFAKKKQSDFWVWDMLADQYTQSEETGVFGFSRTTVKEGSQNQYLACLCKAVSLKSPEDFLVKVRQKLARALVERRLYPEAKTEIEKILKVRKEHQWKIPVEIQGWISEDWYKNSKASESNSAFYNKHLTLAEEILYSDKEEELVLIEFVNTNKKMLTFLTKEKNNGFFNYSRHLKNPKVGETLKVRMEPVGSEGFHKVFTCDKSDEVIDDLIKDFEGQFRQPPNKDFGFIEDVFVEPRTVRRAKLVDGNSYKGTAITTFDKRKKTWGWKAISIS